MVYNPNCSRGTKLTNNILSIETKIPPKIAAGNMGIENFMPSVSKFQSGTSEEWRKMILIEYTERIILHNKIPMNLPKIPVSNWVIRIIAIRNVRSCLAMLNSRYFMAFLFTLNMIIGIMKIYSKNRATKSITKKGLYGIVVVSKGNSFGETKNNEAQRIVFNNVKNINIVPNNCSDFPLFLSSK